MRALDAARVSRVAERWGAERDRENAQRQNSQRVLTPARVTREPPASATPRRPPRASSGLAQTRARSPISQIPVARLVTAGGHDRDERHSTWLELFFDLVFVAAIAQLSSSLAGQPTAAGLVRFAGLFVVVWWVWVELTTYADRFDTDDQFHHLAMLLAMLLAVGLAAAVPGAFRGHTAPFAIAYALLKGEQLVLYERARRQVPEARRLYGRYVFAGSVSACLWLGSLTLAGPARYALWAVAILVEMAAPWLSVGVARAAPTNVSHLPERFGTFLLIVLGESVANLVGAATQRPWTVALGVVLAAAFTTIAAMWWISFNAIDHAFVRRGLRATLGYIYVQLPLVAGIAAASAGLHRAILAAAGAGAIPIAPRAAIYGGTGIYLLASAALPAADRGRRSRQIRLAAAAASFGLVLMGAVVAPVFLVPALALILVGEIWLDARPRRTDASRPPSWQPSAIGPDLAQES
jgi:low temperature requirement protein LtrA